MKQVIKCVKFGECGILEGNKEQLLVDCGSQNKSGKLAAKKFAYQAIEDRIVAKKITDLMISHFDRDHFNGILGVPETYRFRHVYLPYSMINGKCIYTGAISRLLTVAPAGSWGFDLV